MGSIVECDRCGRTARTAAEARGWLHLEDLYTSGVYHPPLDHERLDVDFCEPYCLLFYAVGRWPELGKLLREEVMIADSLQGPRR